MIKRSWELTKGHFWPIVGALLMLGVVLLVLSLLVTMVFGIFVLGLIGNPITDPNAAFVLSLLGTFFSSAVAVFMLCFVAYIYRELAGKTQATAAY